MEAMNRSKQGEDAHIKRLISAVIENNHVLPYINLDDKNAYKGWVSDFHFQFIDGSPMRLDLHDDKDLFLLFVLAVAWSRSDCWENAAYLVAHLKYTNQGAPDPWRSASYVSEQIANRKRDAAALPSYCVGLQSRSKVSFRGDIFSSISVLAAHWDEIVSTLTRCSEQNDYIDFIRYMRSVPGLGAKENRMNMKILLILRELRCQNIYPNIPGALCCVPDKRVKESCLALGIRLPVITTENGLLGASAILYNLFGDLYDIPAFAQEDLIANGYFSPI